jgi:hypothetical protein
MGMTLTDQEIVATILEDPNDLLNQMMIKKQPAGGITVERLWEFDLGKLLSTPVPVDRLFVVDVLITQEALQQSINAWREPDYPERELVSEEGVCWAFGYRDGEWVLIEDFDWIDNGPNVVLRELSFLDDADICNDELKVENPDAGEVKHQWMLSLLRMRRWWFVGYYPVGPDCLKKHPE